MNVLALRPTLILINNPWRVPHHEVVWHVCGVCLSDICTSLIMLMGPYHIPTESLLVLIKMDDAHAYQWMETLDMLNPVLICYTYAHAHIHAHTNGIIVKARMTCSLFSFSPRRWLIGDVFSPWSMYQN